MRSPVLHKIKAMELAALNAHGRVGSDSPLDQDLHYWFESKDVEYKAKVEADPSGWKWMQEQTIYASFLMTMAIMVMTTLKTIAMVMVMSHYDDERQW